MNRARSPLNNREYAAGYVRASLREWAAENHAEDALAAAGLDALEAEALAGWDTRMAGQAGNKRKELDLAVSAVITRRLLGDPAPSEPWPAVYPPGINSDARVAEAIARNALRDSGL